MSSRARRRYRRRLERYDWRHARARWFRSLPWDEQSRIIEAIWREHYVEPLREQMNRPSPLIKLLDRV